jgi:hypothetical protein
MTDRKTVAVEGSFVDTSISQNHYRCASDGFAMLLLRASPGSRKQLGPLGQRLAIDFRQIALGPATWATR